MLNIKSPLKIFSGTPSIDQAEWRDVYESKYADKYSDDRLWEKMGKNFKAIGLKLAYKALQLFYVTKNPKCPTRIKAGIYGALGYLIVPFDAVADILPLVGYTDDLTIIAGTLLLAQLYIDDEVREKAKNRIAQLFGEAAVAEL